MNLAEESSLESTGTRNRWLGKNRTAVILVFIVALTAFGSGIRWGLPHVASPETVQPWALDTIAPITPLNEAYHRFTRSGNEFVAYPLFHYMVLSVAYAPYIGIEFLIGNVAEPSSSFPYGLQDVAAFCRNLTLLARMVSLLMALGIVALVYRITLDFASRQAAVWAALATSLLAPLSYYSKTANLDVPYAFWVCLAVWRFLHILQDQQQKDYLFLGLFTALAIATKDQAYGFFVLIPLVLAFARARFENPTGATFRHWTKALVSPPMLAAGAVAMIAYAAANNVFLGGLDGLLRHLSYGGEIYDYRQQTGTDFYSLASQIKLVARSAVILAQNLGPGSLVLAAVGIVLTVQSRNWKILSLLVFIVSYYVFVIGAFNMVFARYLLVPSILLTPFVGIAIERLLRMPGRWRLASPFLISIALLSQLALVVNLNLTLVADSRQAMADWIHTNVDRGSTIESQVRERMLPHISAGYDVSVAGNSFNTITMSEIEEDLTPAALASRNPDYILIMEGLGVTGDPEGWATPSLQSYYQDLAGGRLGYKKVAEFKTPHFIPFRQIPGTRPRSILLARSGNSVK